MNTTLDLITAFAQAAREPHVLPTPARTAELSLVVAPLRRQMQRRFDVDGLPRGLAKVA